MKTSMKKLKQIAVTSLALGGVLTFAYPKFCQNNSSPMAKPTSYANSSVLSATGLNYGANTTNLRTFSTYPTLNARLLSSAKLPENSSPNNALATNGGLETRHSATISTNGNTELQGNTTLTNGNSTNGDLKTNNSSSILIDGDTSLKGNTSLTNGDTELADIKKYSLNSVESGTLQTAVTYLKTPTLIATDGEHLFVYDSFTNELMAFNSSKTLVAKSTDKKDLLSLQYSGSFLYCLSPNLTTGENEVYRIQMINGDLTYTKVETQKTDFTQFAVSTKANETAGTTTQELLFLLDDNKNFNVETISEDCTKPSSTVSTYEFGQYAKNIQTGELIVLDKNKTHITAIYALNDELLMSYYEEGENSTITLRSVKLVMNSDNNYYKVEANPSGETLYYTNRSTTKNAQNSASNLAISCINSNETTLAFLQTNGTLNLNNGTLTSTNLHDKINSRYPNRFTHLNLSSMTQIGDEIYLTDPENQVIFKFTQTSGSLDIFMENTTPAPETNASSTHKYITTNQQAELFWAPYSITPQEVVPSGTNLVILAEDDENFADFYYCLYTTKTANHYLYLKKTTDIEFLQKTPVATPVKILGSSVPIFALPSTISDSKNTVLETLTDNTILTQATLQTVKNSHGESFYVVSTPSGNTGYVRYTQINSSKNLIATQKVKCNGRTKRETTMFLAPSPDDMTSYSDEEIAEFETLGIVNNTRVKLLEKISAGSTYTPAVYQNDSGQVYYGYILTEDIKSDDLTPLQIIGLALVGVNIILLILIIAFRKHYTSSSNPKSTSGDTSTSTLNEISDKNETSDENATLDENTTLG